MFDIALADTPYGFVLDLAIVIAAACWALSIVTKDYSLMDRMWSIGPAIFVLIVAADLNFDSIRVNLMMALVLAWAIRLTVNLTVKGGLPLGHVDYRWTWLRREFGPVKFQFINLTFTSFGQMAIVFMFTAPIHQAWQHGDQPLGWLDYLAAVVFFLFLAVETIADIQMLRFQQNKKRLISEGAEVSEPFITTGLFRFSRHPSHACEVGMWIAFYLFAISAADQVWHWTGIGCVVLLLMFQGSTRLGEKISLERYPEYRRYQEAVPMYLPYPFRRRRSEVGDP